MIYGLMGFFLGIIAGIVIAKVKHGLYIVMIGVLLIMMVLILSQ